MRHHHHHLIVIIVIVIIIVIMQRLLLLLMMPMSITIRMLICMHDLCLVSWHDDLSDGSYELLTNHEL